MPTWIHKVDKRTVTLSDINLLPSNMADQYEPYEPVKVEIPDVIKDIQNAPVKKGRKAKV